MSGVSLAVVDSGVGPPSQLTNTATTLATRSVLYGQQVNATGNALSIIRATPFNNLGVSIEEPLDASGENYSSIPVPIIQVNYTIDYALAQSLNLTTLSATLANTGNGMVQGSTGTTVNSRWYVESIVRTPDTPGQAVHFKGSAIFGAPVAGSKSVLGLGHKTEGLFFGYNVDTTFNCMLRYGGLYEIRRLTITSGASNASFTVTLNGNVTTIPASGGTLSIHALVYYLCNAANSQLFLNNGNGWRVFPDGASVNFIAVTTGAQNGTYAVSGATVAGTFSQVGAGASASELMIPQSTWNVDKADGTGALPAINLQTGNTFKITTQTMGFGPAVFMIQHPLTCKFCPVHVIGGNNTMTVPLFRRTTLPAHAGIWNVTNTSSVTMSVHTMCVLTSGQLAFPRYTQAFSVFLQAPGQTFATNVYRNILAIRCNSTYKTLDNRSDINLAELYASSSLAGVVVQFVMLLNPTFADPGGSGLNWVQGSTLPNSYAWFTASAVACTGGTQVLSFSGVSGNTINVQFSDRLRNLHPGDVLALCVQPNSTISAALGASGTTDINVSCAWYEPS